uniref:CCR4-Not complex component Not1 C-terminal domain-containing protein n=1 Tax=Spongospora subterranea TaxID=70186 RepID=A0A0H5R5K8_9EUKA|eukprot:CRZ09445.1 hypothetical protein [Spongospora subterranea]
MYWKVSELIRDLNDANVAVFFEVISDLRAIYGADTDIFIIQSYLTYLPTANKAQLQAAKAFFEGSTENILFMGIFTSAFESIEGNNDLLSLIISALHLSLPSCVQLALALFGSSSATSAKQGEAYLIANINEIASDPSLPETILHCFADFVKHSPAVTELTSQSVMHAMRQRHPEMTGSALLLPILYDTSCTNAVVKASVPVNNLEGIGCTITQLLCDQGYSACSSTSLLSDILKQFPTITEVDVSDCIAMFARTYSGLHNDETLPSVFSMVVNNNWESQGGQAAPVLLVDGTAPLTWNVPVFISTISKLFPHIRWHNVFRLFDREGFIVKDQRSLEILMEAHHLALPKSQFPLDILFTSWTNQIGHLSLIRMAIGCSALDFGRSEHIVQPIPGVASPCGTGYGMSNNSWKSLDLIRTLIEMGDSDLYGAVRALFNSPLEHCPEVLLSALAEISVHNSVLKEELLDILIPKYLRVSGHSSPVLSHVWAFDASVVVSKMVHIYLEDYSFLLRILDLSQEIKDSLTVILESRPFRFAIDFAALASRREFLNLDKWLQLRIDEHGNDFCSAVLDYLSQAVMSQLHSVVPVSVELVSSFLSAIRSNSSVLSSENALRFAEISRFVQQSPHPQNDLPVQDNIEEEANSYFQKIYDGKISIAEVINMLISFKKDKSTRREKDIYACMIHNLFDEYRFFQKYPDKELRVTAVLFGTLIRHELTGRFEIDVALRYIYEGLSSPPGTKLHQFGLWAIDEFKVRLSDWPQFSQSLIELASLQDQGELMSSLRAAVSSQTSNGVVLPLPVSSADLPITSVIALAPNPVASATPNSTTSVAAVASPNVALKVASSVNIDNTLEQRGYALFSSLESTLADKLSFLINNVDINNMASKAEELRKLLSPETYHPISHYIVVKRVTSDTNFLKTYILLLDHLKLPEFNRTVLLYTYESINILIHSPTIISLSQERSLLKNLGSWLGLLTIKKNIPPLARHLKFTQIVLDAYNQGRLIAVVPFVAKVLEHCPESRVFRPPNPWLMSVVALLAEIYHVADLKLNLKFEIEVLLNKLGITLADVTIRNYLPIVNQALNQNFRNPKESHELGAAGIPSSSFTARPAVAIHPSSTVSSRNSFQTSDDSTPNGQGYVTINPSLALFATNPRLKTCVSMAVDRAINEIISPVVERSVHIACITTRELICKDFEMEGDDLRMRKAAHQMVQSLTCSLALVTCKEPLRLSISNHLRSLLIANNADHTQAEQAVLTVAGDNLEFGCSIIEKAASERAIRQVDDTLQAEFDIRRKAREHKQSFVDVAFSQGRLTRFPSSVPESLRPRPGLSSVLLNVYDEFGLTRVPAHSLMSPPASSTIQGTLDQLGQLLSQLQTAAAQTSSLSDDSNIQALLQSVQGLLQATIEHEEIALHFTKTIFALYTVPTNSAVSSDLYLAILKITCHSVASGAKLVTLCCISADAQSSGPTLFTLSISLMRGLLRDGLILTPELDAHYAGQFSSASALSISRITSLCALMQSIICNERIVSPAEFPQTLELLNHVCAPLANVNPLLRDTIVALLESIQTVEHALSLKTDDKGAPLTVSSLNDTELGLETSAIDAREAYKVLFSKWMSICLSQSGTLDDAFHQYLAILKSQRVLESEASVAEFCRVIVLMSIERCVDPLTASSAQPGLHYGAIDGFCKLIVCLVKVLGSSSTVYISKAGLLNTFLTVVADLLSRDYEKDPEAFAQRPFFRIFVNLLQDLNANDPELDPISVPILMEFAHVFHVVRPNLVPGFSMSWLELISHRSFMPRLLQSKTHNLMQVFKTLLVDLFTFLQVYLRVACLSDPIRLLYNGTLRVLLVLLHDFPEFLCSYHFSFCDVIPPSCIQMRNVILSAFPRHMRLPDPFLPNLKVDSLPDVKDAPIILSDICAALVHAGLLTEIDQFMTLRHRSESFFADIHAKLLRPKHEIASAGTIYNVQLINSIVLYVGQKGLTGGMSDNIAVTSAMEIFETLVTQLDEEGRYYFLNAITNQLRYPNNQTYYFSCVLLYLFVEAKIDTIQEQITRVLLERLIVHRPHPWGLLITFIELIKNPVYKFWNHEFTHCAPEIERLFDSVARSCMQSLPGSSVDDPIIEAVK